MLWQVLALPLSNALAASGGAPGEVLVCTASGIKWIQASDLPAPEQSRDGEGAHCPLCVLPQDAPALLDSRASFIVPLCSAHELRAEFPVKLSPGISSAAPPPARAPPAFTLI